MLKNSKTVFSGNDPGIEISIGFEKISKIKLLIPILRFDSKPEVFFLNDKINLFLVLGSPEVDAFEPILDLEFVENDTFENRSFIKTILYGIEILFKGIFDSEVLDIHLRHFSEFLADIFEKWPYFIDMESFFEDVKIIIDRYHAEI